MALTEAQQMWVDALESGARAAVAAAMLRNYVATDGAWPR